MYYPILKRFGFFSDCRHVCGIRDYCRSVRSGRLWRHRKHCGKYCQHNHLTHDNTMILNVFKFFVCKFVHLPKIINTVVSLIWELLLLIQKLVMNAHVQLQVCFFPQRHESGNIGIISNFVFQYICSFLPNFHQMMLYCCIVVLLRVCVKPFCFTT